LLWAELRRDVGLVQRGKKFGFALEACHALSVAREVFGHDLDSYVTPELHISRLTSSRKSTEVPNPEPSFSYRIGLNLHADALMQLKTLLCI
jgi:hypothetical protein